jgi:hypothetical protein
MPERFTADVNLTVAELTELCDWASDAMISAINDTQPTTPERFEVLRSLFNKAHDAWGRQIVDVEMPNVIAAAAVSGQPVPPEVTAWLASQANEDAGTSTPKAPNAQPRPAAITAAASADLIAPRSRPATTAGRVRGHSAQ